MADWAENSGLASNRPDIGPVDNQAQDVRRCIKTDTSKAHQIIKTLQHADRSERILAQRQPFSWTKRHCDMSTEPSLSS